MAPNESPCMVSCRSIIEMKSLSLVVYEIFMKIAFDLLTLDFMAPYERPYMVRPYMVSNMSVTLMPLWSLYRSSFMIYLKKR